MLVASIHYFFTLQLHKWQNSTELSAVWRILLQWRHLSPGPRHQPAFLSVSHCLMGEGKWGLKMNVLYYYPHSHYFHSNVVSVPRKPGLRSPRGTISLLGEQNKIHVFLWKEILKLREGLMSLCGGHGTAGGWVPVHHLMLCDTLLWLKVFRQIKMVSKPLQSLPFWTYHTVPSCS